MRKSKLYTIVALLGIIFVGGLAFLNIVKHNDETVTWACTEELKVCPDGTMVRRVAPNCDFAACPIDIGGQRDEKGCLGPAGYTFVESIGACARDWEIDSEDKQKAAQIAVEHVGFKEGLTVISIEVFKCPGCFAVNLANDDELTSVSLIDWEVSLVDEVNIQRLSGKNDSISVSFESDFGTKIVYGISQNVDTALLIKDCEERGGVFNACGSTCESDAEDCITVCAFTCESIPIKP